VGEGVEDVVGLVKPSKDRVILEDVVGLIKPSKDRVILPEECNHEE
jgi:hypothetical protein